jgi:hypothetical protein
MIRNKPEGVIRETYRQVRKESQVEWSMRSVKEDAFKTYVLEYEVRLSTRVLLL